MATRYTADAFALSMQVDSDEEHNADVWHTFWTNKGFAQPPALDARIATYSTLATAQSFSLGTATAADKENQFWQQYNPILDT